MQHDYEFDDVLRRALHVAANSVEPGADGLERIRARLTDPRPMSAAWLLSCYADLARPIVVRLRWALDGLIAWLWPPASKGGGRRPSQPGQGSLRAGKLSQRYRWVRPVAVASAIVVAVAGGYGLTQLRSTMSDTGELILPLVGGNAHTPGGTLNGRGSGPIPGPSGTAGGGLGSQSASPSPSVSCSPGLGKVPHVHGSIPASPQPSATPTPTPDPTPTPTPTITPTDTPTPTPTLTDGGATASSPDASPGVSPGANPGANPGAVVYQAQYASAAATPKPSRKTSTPTPKDRCGSPGPSTRNLPNQGS